MTDRQTQLRNLEIVMSIAENGLTGRWDLVRPLIADDVVLRLPESLPWGGVGHGWDAYQQGLATMGRYVADFVVADTSFEILNDAIVIRMNIAGRVVATGKAFSMPLLEFWRLRDGQVCEITAYFFDTKALVD